jgi:hypothetical protein
VKEQQNKFKVVETINKEKWEPYEIVTSESLLAFSFRLATQSKGADIDKGQHYHIRT